MECLPNYVSGRLEDYAYFSLTVKHYLRLSLPRKSAFRTPHSKIPTGFHPSAQGCDGSRWCPVRGRTVATLGSRFPPIYSFQRRTSFSRLTNCAPLKNIARPSGPGAALHNPIKLEWPIGENNESRSNPRADSTQVQSRV